MLRCCMPRGPSTRWTRWTRSPLPPREGVRLPRRESGARDRHPGPRRDRQHVGVPGARLPAPFLAVHRRLRWSRSQLGTRARTRSCRDQVPDGLPRLARGGGLPSTLAIVARGQQPAPSAVIDFRRVLGASARLASVAPRGPGSSGCRGPRSTAGMTRRRCHDVIVDEELARAGAPPRPSLGYLVQAFLHHARRGREGSVPARPDRRDRPLVPGLQRA